MIQCILSNQLEVIGLPPDVEDWLESHCVFNTVAFQSDRVPSRLNLFTRKGNSIFIPRGFLHLIKKYSEKNNIPLKIDLDTAQGDALNLQVSKEINYKTGTYGYQDRVTQELIKHNTVRLQAPTGSGKTSIACITSSLIDKGPILFLANKERLLKQFILTAEKVLNIPEDEVGIIKAKKYKIQPLTVGSLQTMGKDDFDLDKIKNTFHTVFFDECHISTALTYRRVLTGLAPTHLIGLSATPEHYSSEDLNWLMTALLGDIGVIVRKDEIPQRIIPQTCTRETNLRFKYLVSDGSPTWMKHKCRNAMYKAIAASDERNDLIIKDCRILVANGHKVLITVQRVSHGDILYRKLEEYGVRCSFPYKYSKKKKKEVYTVNHKKLNEDVILIEKDKIDVLIGTYSLFQTGFDCKSLSAILFASPFSGTNSTMVTQAVGRIQRHAFGKTDAYVIDYTDDSSPNNILRKWSEDRATKLSCEFRNHIVMEKK